MYIYPDGRTERKGQIKWVDRHCHPIDKEYYTYDNIEIVPYWNGYKVYYWHENGNREQLGFQMTKWAAELLGRAQVDYMNKGEN